jgi:hypothetical protein
LVFRCHRLQQGSNSPEFYFGFFKCHPQTTQYPHRGHFDSVPARMLPQWGQYSWSICLYRNGRHWWIVKFVFIVEFTRIPPPWAPSAMLVNESDVISRGPVLCSQRGQRHQIPSCIKKSHLLFVCHRFVPICLNLDHPR